MPPEWTGLGPELLLTLDRSRRAPLRAQLEAALRDAIRSGRLRADERLPSSRALAASLGVSRGLVLDCYRQLQAEGYLSARPGSATRVAGGAQARPVERRPQLPRPPAIDFAPGVPDLTSFPRRDWLWALRQATANARAQELGYDEGRGSWRLREVLAGYLRRVRGAAAEPEQIVICSAFAQGLNLTLAVLRARGVSKVAIEDPGDVESLRAAIVRAGLEPVTVSVDDAGLDVVALRASDVGAVVVTPAHQSPTGVVMAPERRLALLEWAAETEAFVIEDDYDAEFRYDRDPVGALQGLDPSRVVTIGTVSKSLAPGLRLGWVVAPPPLVDALFVEKALADRGSPALDQLALAELIESGRYDRHLRQMRIVYARRRDVLVETLGRVAPDVVCSGLAAGFHLVARLPDSVEESALVEAARSRSVGLYGMSAWRGDHASVPPQLVVGFGNVNEEAIVRGLETVGSLLL